MSVFWRHSYWQKVVDLWSFMATPRIFRQSQRKVIERFHSRGQHLSKFIGKESFYIRKEFNSHRISLEHQHGCRFIVLEHQYGRRDVMWKRSIGKVLQLTYSVVVTVVYFNPQKREFSVLLVIPCSPYSMLGYNNNYAHRHECFSQHWARSSLPNTFDDDCS